MRQDSRVFMIAGPHGAGKTTFAHEYLPHHADCRQWVDTEAIALGLAPLAPETAQTAAEDVMRDELDRHFLDREDFAVETTLGHVGLLQPMRRWQAGGYRVTLIFLQLDDPALAVARCNRRALIDGLPLMADDIRRDFGIGLAHLKRLYAPQADEWVSFDNSGVRPVLLDHGEKGAAAGRFTAQHVETMYLCFEALRRAARRVQDMAALTGTPIVISRYSVLENIDRDFDAASVAIHESRPRQYG